MKRAEKLFPVLTGLFFVLCAAVFLLQTAGPAAVSAGGVLYSAEEAGASPSVQEKFHAALGKSDPGAPSGGRMNINTASAEELAALPGIGDVLAARIVRYRTYNGDFAEASHIRDVTGIGDALYAKIADLICTG